MRDPKRLDNFYTQLNILHQRYCPDIRFFQLISNITTDLGNDFFYAEEDKALEIIAKYLGTVYGNEPDKGFLYREENV